MLPIGMLAPHPDIGPGPRATRLSAEEQKTQITLWSIARSPLILGANLTMLDDETLRLITNRDVIRVNQTATGSREVLRKGQLVVWTADLPSRQTALAVFNLGDAVLSIDISIKDLGIAGAKTGRKHLKNVWTGTSERLSDTLSFALPAHGSQLYLAEQ